MAEPTNEIHFTEDDPTEDTSRDPDPQILKDFKKLIEKNIDAMDIVIDEIVKLGSQLSQIAPYNLLEEIKDKYDIMALGRILDARIEKFKKLQDPILTKYSNICKNYIGICSRRFNRELHRIHFGLGKYNQHCEALNSIERAYIVYKCMSEGVRQHPANCDKAYYFIDSRGDTWKLQDFGPKLGGIQFQKNNQWRCYLDNSSWPDTWTSCITNQKF